MKFRLLFAFFALIAFASHAVADGQPDAIQQCMDATMKKLQPSGDKLEALERIGQLCSKTTYWNFLIRDFDYRRQKFERQTSDDRVLLWMVVAITVAGVVLSAVQLIGSYHLASLGRAKFGENAGEVGIQAGKLSVHSSITGLLILAVSFAFFLVFVQSVYQFREDNVSYPSSAEPSGRNLGNGGLGQAPHH